MDTLEHTYQDMIDAQAEQQQSYYDGYDPARYASSDDDSDDDPAGVSIHESLYALTETTDVILAFRLQPRDPWRKVTAQRLLLRFEGRRYVVGDVHRYYQRKFKNYEMEFSYRYTDDGFDVLLTFDRRVRLSRGIHLGALLTSAKGRAITNDDVYFPTIYYLGHSQQFIVAECRNWRHL